MDRRTWLRSTAAFAAGALGGARGGPGDVAAAESASAPGGTRRIGILHQSPANGAVPRQVLQGYAERGWVEGQNLRFELRAGSPDGSDLDALARELASLPVDLFLTFGTPATLAAKRATSRIPIMFSLAADPVQSGIVASLARSGTNCTGTYFGLYDEKLLEQLKLAVTTVRRVLYPMRQPSPQAYRVAEALRVEIRGFPVRDASGFDAFFAAIGKEKCDGVVVPNVNWMERHAARIARGVNATGTPSIAAWPQYSKDGGLLSYGPTDAGVFRRRLDLVDALLRGANPADMPVEMPTQFHLGINLVTAKALRVQIPKALLATADPNDVIRE